MPSHNKRYRCCVCKSFVGKVVDGKKVSFHRFPANERHRRLWIQRCSFIRPNFVFLINSARLCSNHFVSRSGPTKTDPIPCYFPRPDGSEIEYNITQLDETPTLRTPTEVKTENTDGESQHLMFKGQVTPTAHQLEEKTMSATPTEFTVNIENTNDESQRLMFKGQGIPNTYNESTLGVSLKQLEERPNSTMPTEVKVEHTDEESIGMIFEEQGIPTTGNESALDISLKQLEETTMQATPTEVRVKIENTDEENKRLVFNGQGIPNTCNESTMGVSLKQLEERPNSTMPTEIKVEHTDEESIGMIFEEQGIPTTGNESALDISLKQLEETTMQTTPTEVTIKIENTDEENQRLMFEEQGILITCDESALDISLKTRFHLDAELASAMFQKFLDKRQEAAVYIFHDYVNNVPLPAPIRHQCEQTTPCVRSVKSQTQLKGRTKEVARTMRAQIPHPRKTDTPSQARLPSLTFDDICDNDSKVLFYTGIPDARAFMCLFDKMEKDMCRSVEGRPKSLRLIDEFFMVLMRIKLGLFIEDLADRFLISKSTCSTICKAWIDYMSHFARKHAVIKVCPVFKNLEKLCRTLKPDTSTPSTATIGNQTPQ